MLLIRCDANTDIGAGHFFRELALAEAAIDRDIPVAIVMHRPAESFVSLADAADVELVVLEEDAGSLEDAARFRDIAEERGATAVVVDGYHFNTAFYEVLASGEFILAAVDDIAHQLFPVDVLVNVNINADELTYETRPDTRKLLGVDYTLLRRQFRALREAPTTSAKTPATVKNLFVMLGGGDVTNETSKVLRALQIAAYEERIDVVIGPSNPHRASVLELSDQFDASVSVHQNISEMAQVMDGQDLAICAGGQSVWELACLGVPTMQIVVAPNQEEVVRTLASREITRSLGHADSLTALDIAEQFRSIESQISVRERMQRKAMLLIDGQGGERVLRELVKDSE